MHLRPIVIDDYPRLIEFWNLNYFVNEMENIERFRLFLEKNPGLSIVAEENNMFVGTALGSFDGRRGYLQKIVVDKKLRRQGIGQLLVKEVIRRLRALECTYISLAVEEKLIGFYERCGFKKTTQLAMNMNLSDNGKYQEYVRKKNSV